MFGGFQLAAMSYPDFVGLWLNVDRVRLQQAVAVSRGMGLAGGTDDVPNEYLEAMTRTPEEADALAWETNLPRLKARVMAGLQR